MSRRYRIKLITVPWELEVPTLGLASLAAVTPPVFDIAIVDVLRERLFLDEPVDLVGISASTPRVRAAYAIADLYRSRGVKVVIGGHHATALPDEALLHADAVVVGEGETSWRRICEQFLQNPSHVGGIYRDPPPNLAELPQPRVDLMKIERHSTFYYPVIASRGCPESCSFCFAKRMTRGYRTYPIAHVLDQVRRRPSFVRSMYFVDDNLPGDVDYANELFRALRRHGVPFGMQARHEFARDAANLRLAREAGCALISSGYESVNQMSLDNTGKRASALEYRALITNILREGILPSGNWMFGFDWDGPDVFARTLEFLDSTDLIHCSFTTEIPFPGTAAFQQYRREGRILTENYDHYVGKDHVVVRPKQMTPEQLRDGVRWLATRFYSPARALRRSRRGLASPRLLESAGSLRVPALLFLNAFQVWQWHYRMVPRLNRLYRWLGAANKYRFASDHVLRTNFRKPTPLQDPPRHQPPSTASAFYSSSGHKRSRKAPLVPVLRES